MPGAFFMSLFEHARKNPGIAIVVSLASVQDAFSAETSGLARMLTEASGKEMGGEDAIIKQESAMSVISTVLARDETVVIPVQAKDLSSVLAKRLFESIDPAEARRSAEEYRELYRRNASLLPPGFRLDDYVEEMASSYPFHPTLVELLNKKLSTVPTFQRTRGVLRILALAVRSLWLKERDPSAIHACHLDFMDSRTVDELFGRTDNSALLSVVNADVGTADTSLLKAGRSNAEIADDENRHPQGVPYHVDTWKTVLLHSLAGQSQRLSSTVFGIAETDAILATARPELTPAQVQEALKSISEKAYYLHFGSGRYYADTLPSINVPLSSIRKSLTEEQLCTELEAKLRKVVTEDRRGFSVVTDVAEPQHIPDATNRPVLALLSPRLKTADPAVFITRRQHDQPRIQQNRVFLLVPEIVSIKRPSDDRTLFDVRAPEAEVVLQEIYDLVRSVLAMKRLQDSPNDYAITHEQLRAHDFRAKLAEREKALETRVSRLCKYLVYPSEDPVFSVAEIRTAGGEGGEAMRTQIRTALQNVGKLLSEDNINRATLSGLRDLLFEASDRITVGDAQKRFYERRGWPALESLELLPRIVSEGVRQGLWCAAVGFDDQEARPDRFFNAGNQVPLNEIPDPDWLLVTPEGARKRGWGSEPRLTQRDYRDLVDGLLQKRPSARFDEALSEVGRVNPDADPDQVKEAMIDLARHGRVHIFEGDPDQTERPDRLVSGAAAVSVGALDNIVVISDEEAGRRGWKGHDDRRIVLGKDDLDTILALTRRLGPLYARGATTVIDRFELYEFELPGGTRMSVELGMIGPDSIRHMAEMLEIMSDKLVPTSESDARLEIDDPDDECPLVREIAERRRH